MVFSIQEIQHKLLLKVLDLDMEISNLFSNLMDRTTLAKRVCQLQMLSFNNSLLISVLTIKYCTWLTLSLIYWNNSSQKLLIDLKKKNLSLMVQSQSFQDKEIQICSFVFYQEIQDSKAKDTLLMRIQWVETTQNLDAVKLFLSETKKARKNYLVCYNMPYA